MSSIRRLVTTEAKLFLREPVSLIFVLAFPALVVLILGGVFDPEDPSFGGAAPSDYIAAYIGVVLAAVGFIMLPVHLASYRERACCAASTRRTSCRGRCRRRGSSSPPCSPWWGSS